VPGYVDIDDNPPEACAPWATAAQVTALGSRFDTIGDTYLLTDALLIATDILYVLTGRRWPGVCGPITVRPCARRHSTRNIPDWSEPYGWMTGWGWCGCSGDTCGCPGRAMVDLGEYPIVAVSAVKVDGATLNPVRYRVDDHRWLVRLDDADGSNPGWPCCQDLTAPDSAEHTWSVAFTHGAAPPPAGVYAAALLAGEIGLSLIGSDDCSLGPNVTQLTRQGVTIQMSSSDFVNDLPEVARAFVKSANPHGIGAEPSIWSPEHGSAYTVTGT
jgi:hypothetical protein